MSKKKPIKKDSETIDASLMGEPKSEKKITPISKVSLKEYYKTAPFSFNAKNYRLLLIGLAINILGFILMIGGATDDPSKFNADELFSHRRITIAPMLIIAGYLVIMYSIMKKSKSAEN